VAASSLPELERLHRRARRGTEALTAVLGHAFETFDLHRVIAVTVLNAPAAALLERAGMRREGHFVENIYFRGAWGSEFLVAILEREWAARRCGCDELRDAPGLCQCAFQVI
jgi:RimJ/RimL family protein N-acetyltransferase